MSTYHQKDMEFDQPKPFQQEPQLTTELIIDNQVYQNIMAPEESNKDEFKIEGLYYFIQIHQEQMKKSKEKMEKAIQILNNSTYNQSQRITKAIDILNDLQTSVLYPQVDQVKSVSYQSPSFFQKQITQEYAINKRSQKQLIMQKQINELKITNKQLNDQFLIFSTEKETRILELQEYQRNYQHRQVQNLKELQITKKELYNIRKSQVQNLKELQATKNELENIRELYKIQRKNHQAKEISLNQVAQRQLILKGELNQLEADISKERQEFKQKMAVLEEKMNKLQNYIIEQSIKSIEIPIYTGDQQLNSLKQENQYLKTQVHALKVSIDEEKRLQQQWKIKYDNFDQEIDRKKKQWQQFSIGISKKQKQLEQIIQNFEMIVVSLKSQKENQDTQLQNMSNQLKQLYNTKQHLLLQIKTYQLEIKSFKNQQKYQKQNIFVLNELNESLNQFLQDKNVYILELENQIQKDNQWRVKMTKDFQNMQNQIKQASQLRQKYQNSDLMIRKLHEENEKVSQQYRILKQRYKKDTKNNSQRFFNHMASLVADMDRKQLFSFKEAIKIKFVSFIEKKTTRQLIVD